MTLKLLLFFHIVKKNTMLLSKATKSYLDNLVNKNCLIELRDRSGLLLGVSNNLHTLQGMKQKDGKFIYRVDEKQYLNYDHVKTHISHDIYVQEYVERKEFFGSEKQILFLTKQENYWKSKIGRI